MDNLSSDEQRAVSLLVSAFEVIRRNQPSELQGPGNQNSQESISLQNCIASNTAAEAATSASTSRSGGSEAVLPSAQRSRSGGSEPVLPSAQISRSGGSESVLRSAQRSRSGGSEAVFPSAQRLNSLIPGSGGIPAGPARDSPSTHTLPRPGGFAFNPSTSSILSSSSSGSGGFTFTPSPLASLRQPQSFRLNAESGGVSRRGLRAEMRELFSPYPDASRSNPRSRNARSRMTSRKFVCLPSPSVTKAPTSAQKSILGDFKLGEKTVTTHVGASSEELIADIKLAYPKLRDIQFELMRSHGHARQRNLHRIDDLKNVPSLPEINALRLGACFIRPFTSIVTEQEMTRYIGATTSEISDSASMNTARIDTFLVSNSTTESMSGTDDELLDISDNEVGGIEENGGNQESGAVRDTSNGLLTNENSVCNQSTNHEDESNRDPGTVINGIGNNCPTGGLTGHGEVSSENSGLPPSHAGLNLERLRDPGILSNNIPVASNSTTHPEPSFSGMNASRFQIRSTTGENNADGGAMIIADKIDIYDCPTFDELRIRIHSQSSETQFISVDRKDNFFHQVIGIYMKDSSFNLKLKPQVKFFREPAHDHGGVTREYFECCLAALPTFQLHGRYALFEGETDHLLPSTDSALLRSGVFYAIGKLMAHCLLNTGIAAYGLAKPFVQYMVTPIIDDLTPFTIKPDDIPDLTFREALQIIDKWTEENYIFDEYEKNTVFQVSATVGFNGEVSFANRGLLKEVICLHGVIDTRRAQMDQFKKAFQDLGLVTFLHDREYLWASAFPSDTENRCPASLLKKHILYIGENTERVKLMLESIIDDYTADERERLLVYWQSWRQLIPEQTLTVHVAQHEFAVHTCTNTLDIPEAITETQLKQTLAVLIEDNGFTAV